MEQTSWWERRWFIALLIAASAVPLLWPETPPLVDVPGHIARYRVQLDLASSPELQRYFEFHWALVANLGVDLLVIPLAPIFGLELAVKLIIIAIPPLTVVGLIWIAKEVHGRVPPTVMFAIPFVYGYPFNYGFINFSLSLALALIAFGLWLNLANANRRMFRAWLLVPISCLIWLAHAFGWGILGLLAFSSELVRHRDGGSSWQQAFLRATVAVIPLSVPVLFMIIWRSGAVGGQTDHYFQVYHKLLSLVSALKDRWLLWDSIGLGAVLVLLGTALTDNRFQVSNRLVIPGAILAFVFVMMPGRIFGSAYADSRLAPVMIMITLLAIRVGSSSRSISNQLAWLGLAFLMLRLGSNTISFAMADRQARLLLTALDHVPRGSPVLTLTGDSCNERWEMPRHRHFGSFVIIRRYGFSNDQWQAAGAQLLRIRYTKAGGFMDDRSTFIYFEGCVRRKAARANGQPINDRSTAQALAQFPRDA
jgi:hypothetical protein